MTTLSQLTAAHEAAGNKTLLGGDTFHLFAESMQREAEALRLLTACLPYVKDWVRDNKSVNSAQNAEWIIARDLLKELEG